MTLPSCAAVTGAAYDLGLNNNSTSSSSSSMLLLQSPVSQMRVLNLSHTDTDVTTTEREKQQTQ